MGIAVGIWLNDEPLGLAFLEADPDPNETVAVDYFEEGIQTWVTNADSLAEAVEEMKLSEG